MIIKNILELFLATVDVIDIACNFIHSTSVLTIFNSSYTSDPKSPIFYQLASWKTLRD